MAVALTQFLGQIQLECVGVLQPVALHALRRTLQTLCQMSLVWQKDLAAFSLSDGIATYDLNSQVGSDSQIVQIVERPKVTRPDATEYFIDRKTRNMLERESSTWQTNTSDTLTGIHVVSFNTVRVYPKPNADAAASTVAVRVVLEPNDTASSVDDIFYNDGLLRQAVEDGTVSKLMLQPKKDWSNDMVGMLRAREFRRAITQAFNKQAKQATGADLMVQPVSFGK